MEKIERLQKKTKDVISSCIAGSLYIYERKTGNEQLSPGILHKN